MREEFSDCSEDMENISDHDYQCPHIKNLQLLREWQTAPTIILKNICECFWFHYLGELCFFLLFLLFFFFKLLNFLLFFYFTILRTFPVNAFKVSFVFYSCSCFFYSIIISVLFFNFYSNAYAILKSFC